MSEVSQGPQVGNQEMRFQTQTVVVDGPLALRMRRLEAARAGEIGSQIVTLPQLAARLAGGFVRPASAADIELAAQESIGAGGFAEITPIEGLPGMVRAAVQTLERLWRAGITVEDHAAGHPRLADLALLDARVRATLGGGAHVQPDLVRAALARRHLFARLAGHVTFDHVHYLAPVWRELVEALAATAPVTWRGCEPPTGWAAGLANPPDETSAVAVEVVTCAHPQAEAIEALRWARELMAAGKASPSEIAIVAASPEAWDDSLLGLAAAASLPLHFSHGVPALCSIEGQSCAALADLLAQGLSYGRVQRLLAHSAGRSQALPEIPGQPLAGIPAGAALATIDQWRRALKIAVASRSDGFDIATMLEPVLALAAQGLASAEEAGERLLPRGAAALWHVALRRAPAAALPFTLSSLRIPDGKDPGANVVWGPAGHLVGAPRPWMRLVGMTSRAWPRPRRDDPLLPEHIFPIQPDMSPSRPDVDRRRFAAICRGASAGLSLSYARRSPQGGAQAPSPLLPADAPRLRLTRLRIPDHAFSESDRLQARPKDGADQPRLARPMALARSRRKLELTPWDGLVRADHPVIIETLAQVQSSSSLRRLLRDPQAFVWRYALGWRATLEESQTLSLDDRAFGEIVHQLLQYTVTALEGGPGFARAADHEIDEALAHAAEQVLGEWPSMRPTPPPMLWRHTLDKAAQMALTALKLDGSFMPGTRSWTEVAFGDENAGGSLPWDPRAQVAIPGTSFTIRGRIDRVEIAAGDAGVRITDYKTGSAPAHASNLVLGEGAELQRVLYSIAAHQHVPEAAVRADLVYLGDDAPQRYRIPDAGAAMARAAELLSLATGLLKQGVSLPGPDAKEDWNSYRLARPAAGEPISKDGAIADAFGAFRHVWSER